MVAAGEVNVDGLIELDLRFKILAENEGLAFGVCSREFASVLPVQAMSPPEMVVEV